MYAEKTTKHHLSSNNIPHHPNKYFAHFTAKKQSKIHLQIWKSNNKFILESCFLLNTMFVVRDVSKHMENADVGAQK